jgi:hypothetical protein
VAEVDVTRSTPVRRAVAALLIPCSALGLVLTGCSVARHANKARSVPTTALPVPTAIAPPQAEGLNGVGGSPGPNACISVAGPLTSQLGVKLTARPNSWNDGGLPAFDLCALYLPDRLAVIGITALPSQPDALNRLAAGVAAAGTSSYPLPELAVDAQVGNLGAIFTVGDRAVRITSASGLDRAVAVSIGRAVAAVVPTLLRAAHQSDATCQPAESTAERFVGSLVQLRRDYRVNGALTCIWGTFDATVSIVESVRPDTIPEARRTPPPRPAPVGQPGYYLPEEGELVFRQGRRVVRVTALTDPAQPVTLATLLDIVEPLMPLFLR